MSVNLVFSDIVRASDGVRESTVIESFAGCLRRKCERDNVHPVSILIATVQRRSGKNLSFIQSGGSYDQLREFRLQTALKPGKSEISIDGWLAKNPIIFTPLDDTK